MTDITLNLRHLLTEYRKAIPIDIPTKPGIEDFLDFVAAQECRLNNPELLAEQRMIAVIWCTNDVREQRHDLNDNQAWQVLQACKRHHDCEHGITWDTINYAVDDLFGAQSVAD